MAVLIMLLAAELVLIIIFVFTLYKEIINFIFVKHKIKVYRILIKVRHSYYDYGFMTNLSMSVFASSLVAIVVSSGMFTLAYSVMAIFSFIAMIDYNYKK